MTNKEIKVGARWDDSSQNQRFEKAKQKQLLDYVEVNYPISACEDPTIFNLPILAHTSNNPVCNPKGMNAAVVSAVKSGADLSDSPWVGEHLAWLGFAKSGALGYVINPLFTKDFAAIAVSNTLALKEAYGRQVALELGPVYSKNGEFESEMHFLGEVARKSDSLIILDVTHWTISNRNLRRPEGYGLEGIDLDKVVELHVAGMRCSQSVDFWHDAHGLPVSSEIFEQVKYLTTVLPQLKVVTLEHSMEGLEEDFIKCLERLNKVVKS